MNPPHTFEPAQPPQGSSGPEQAQHSAGQPKIDTSSVYFSPDAASPPVTAMPEQPELNNADPSQPIAVVRVLSTRGVEYGMMTLALWIVASSAAWVILNLLNGGSGFDTVVVPTSALVVCLPIFGFFFLRLKKAEYSSPALRLDPSKRRWTQLTQFLAYIALLINFIYFVYSILQKVSGNQGPSIGKALANLAVVTVIAGGVLAYYWIDEHRRPRG